MVVNKLTRSTAASWIGLSGISGYLSIRPTDRCLGDIPTVNFKMGVSNLFIVLVSNCFGLFLNSELGFFLFFVIRTLIDKWDGRIENAYMQ